MEKKYKITLDTDKQEILDTNIVICQGDKGFIFDIGIDGIDTTGTTVQVMFKKSDGNVVEATLTATNGRYPYTFLGNEVSACGTVIADVKMTSGTTQRISTTKFKFTVEADTENDTPLQSEAYSTSLAEAIEACVNASQHIVANDLTTTEAGKALDARQGKILNDNLENLVKVKSFTLSSTEATQTIIFPELVGYQLFSIAPYGLITKTPFITDVSWNSTNGQLIITRSSASAYIGEICTLFAIKLPM